MDIALNRSRRDGTGQVAIVSLVVKSVKPDADAVLSTK
jgi:hypothetical protein